MATRKQKRLAGEAKAREDEAERQRLAAEYLRIREKRRKARKRQMLRAENAEKNVKAIHKVHKEDS